MKRVEKGKKVESLSKALSDARLLCLGDFQGLNVQEMTSLRQALRISHTEFHVVKNTLAKRAIQGTPLEVLEEHFSGPTGVAFSAHDPVEPAKVLIRFSKDNPKLKLKAGLLEGKVLSTESIEELSKLPSRETLLASLLGTLKSPPTGLVNVLSGVIRKFLWVLRAIDEERAKAGNS